MSGSRRNRKRRNELQWQNYKQGEEKQKKVDTYQKMLIDATNTFDFILEPTSWDLSQHKAVLEALKSKMNIVMPTRNVELYEQWLQW